MAYGTAAGAANYCTVYTKNGVFDNTTRPTLLTVESWLTQISRMLDISLANHGFTAPLTDTNGVSAATMIVEQLASDLAKAANNSGRFFSENSLKSGVSFWKVISNDIDSWVEMYAPGGDVSVFEIGHRENDEAGNDVPPIFQRKAFGNDFQDWDQ